MAQALLPAGAQHTSSVLDLVAAMPLCGPSFFVPCLELRRGAGTLACRVETHLDPFLRTFTHSSALLRTRQTESLLTNASILYDPAVLA